MYAYVCMYMYVHMYAYVCMNIYVYVYVYVCLYICLYMHICICMFICMYMYVCMYACVCVSVCLLVCLFVCVCVCVSVTEERRAPFFSHVCKSTSPIPVFVTRALHDKTTVGIPEILFSFYLHISETISSPLQVQEDNA